MSDDTAGVIVMMIVILVGTTGCNVNWYMDRQLEKEALQIKERIAMAYKDKLELKISTEDLKGFLK